MSDQEKMEIVEKLEQCIALLDVCGVNSKMNVKNSLTDIVKDLRGEPKSIESGLPF